MKIVALLLALPAITAAVYSFSDTDRFLRSREKPKHYDRETLRLEITRSLSLLEALAIQIPELELIPTAATWALGERDFHLKRSVVSACRESCELLVKARQAEKAGQDRRAEALRQKARSKISNLHRNASQNFLTDLRSWLMMAEGLLRRSGEEKGRATP